MLWMPILARARRLGNGRYVRLAKPYILMLLLGAVIACVLAQSLVIIGHVLQWHRPVLPTEEDVVRAVGALPGSGEIIVYDERKRSGIGYLEITAIGPTVVVYAQSGWPFTCFEGAMWREYAGGEWTSAGAFELSIAGLVATIPYRPAWMGVVANSVIWAAPFIVFQAVSILRQRVRYSSRIRRGACGQCGYPLDGLRSKKCPECGSSCASTHAAHE